MALIASATRGHQKVRQALGSALKLEKLSSALLFRGPEGVGKKLVALSLAQDLLCEKTPACGVCGSCLRVLKRQHEGLLVISTDEISLKLDDIQPIFEFVRLKLIARARIIIIDDAHKLNIQAANRLLKSIEEPPPNTHFILITSQELALPITIRSRCQLVRFGPLGIPELKALAEAPTWVYNACQGRMDLLEKLTKESGEERKFAFNLFKNFLIGERSYLFSQFSEFAKDKERTLEILAFFEQFLRDLWIAGMADVKSAEQLIHRDYESEYKNLNQFDPYKIEKLWLEIGEIKKAIEMNADRTLNLENLWFNLHEMD